MFLTETKENYIDKIYSLLYDFNTTDLQAIYSSLWNIKQEEYKRGLSKRNNQNATGA